jgi:Mg2+ and Co2+ transporter CorA
MDVRLINQNGVVHFPVEALPDLLEADDGIVWVDIPECDEQAAHVLSRVFAFHPLAVKDCLERNRVPKAHGYTDHVFFVMHKPERGQRGHVHYIELDQFVGHRFLVTVHGPTNPAVDPSVAVRETEAVLARLEEGRLRPGSPFELSYAIVSSLTRQQEDYLEAVTADVWRLEQQVTGDRLGEPEEFVEELFQARHGLLAVRTMAALSAAICGAIATMPRISQDGKAWVAEMAAGLTKVRNVADGEREYLQGVIDFYQTVLALRSTLAGQEQTAAAARLTEASYAQNEEIKRISAWAAILFAPTLVGTIYGMNFDHMPELHWKAGYPAALLLMLLTSLALYAAFRNRDWI